MPVIVVGGEPAPVPYAPSLISPANGSYADLSGTPTFVWQYQPGQPGLVQTAWQFLRLTNGGSLAQFWNAGTTSWQSSPVWNSGATQSYTFPSASFFDGNIYQWAVATQDANGTGPASAYWTINAQGIPTVTVTQPSGTIATADPIVAWSVSYPSGATQTSYRVVIYTAAQYGVSGFTPGVSPSTYDTGQVGSAFQTTLDLSAIPLYLANTTSYRAYVQVTETGGQFSNWAYSAFTVNFSAPNTPTITATAELDPIYDTEYPTIVLAIQGNDNLLSVDDANPTLGIGSWFAVEGCIVDSSADGLVMRAT